jgi:hypothetical protein
LDENLTVDGEDPATPPVDEFEGESVMIKAQIAVL